MIMTRKMEFIQRAVDGAKYENEDNRLNWFDKVEPSPDQLREIERKKKKKSKLHFLDRPDVIIYGGYLRYKFYRKEGGKNPITLETDVVQLVNDHRLLKEFLQKKGVTVDEIYLKCDSNNRDLPVIVLALLQLYDFVLKQGDILEYGFIKIKEKPKSIEDRVRSFAKRAKELSQSVAHSSVNSNVGFEQLTLF